ncbi:MAG: hypothetical protein CSA35_01100 [Dethiosulfovibrio peptidovorans]|nr:MAG: hypothetical protein CSA35_01100 [Dethiosulfovibrio peptidovorans]
MPAGWFVTYDGYPVSQLEGRWVYGLPNGCGGWYPSSYVVGSVVPTAVPQLTPVNNVVSHGVVNTASTTPVSVCAGSPMPRWLTNTYFTSVAGWNRVVDRMAVLNRPRIPLAWKGDKPAVLYAWTGQSWYQMRTKAGESPAATLKRNVYALTCMAHQNGFLWNDGDTAILAAQAPLWGYMWMGRVAPINL